jgi:hypothetical protein
MLRRFQTLALVVTLPLLSFGCALEDDGASPYDDEHALANIDDLLADAPSNDSLPDENKADAEYPALSADLVAVQSEVKSQGRRGVCSIFSTTGLMEHLYIVEGSLPKPDFSEQYMQWSAKFQVNSFPNTSGSNARSNLESAYRFGIVEEDKWKYEAGQWNASNDAECEGDDMPTRCYTNGAPPQEAIDAYKWRLPRGRWLNTNSIKAHITNNKTAVVVGMTFFYQSWNHRKSELPVNSDDWKQGIVMYPNEADKEKSLVKRAGHSILIVGWDDNLEVPVRDSEGNIATDEDGNELTEKGFYIFKNSWGTGNFGRTNPHGDGYGYLSMRYVHEYGTAYIAGLPDVDLPDELCDDGADNDFNGDTDCDDAACSEEPMCNPDVEVHTFSSDEISLAIPDNDPVGVSSTVSVEPSLDISALSINVDITHTYRGDLHVILYRGTEAVVLHDGTGGGVDDLKKNYAVTEFDGTDATGEWRLKVEDRAGQDTGTLNSWSLEVLTGRE